MPHPPPLSSLSILSLFLLSLFLPLLLAATPPADTNKTPYTPPRFMAVHPTSISKANKHWREAHLTWRSEYKVDDMLVTSERPNFKIIKEKAPHSFLGFDKEGHIIFLQRPGLIDFKGLRKSGVSTEDVLSHFIFVFEYCWNILDYMTIRKNQPPTPPHSPCGSGLMTSLIDLRGLNPLVALNPSNFDFLSKFVNTLSMHYPSRSHLTIIVNAPAWFPKVYGAISPLLREKTREKVRVIGDVSGKGKHVDANRAALRDMLGDDCDLSFLDSRGSESLEERNFIQFAEGTSAQPI
ncbi:hypothetical protein TrCOL_g5531 [Triparma columacea]|uniref:CRAL-TRIO domain-containing protein n=1 Tax=Triparma columacea TaxID=722753 RepID=A0A9W7G2P3_9STRA|nr:hypothetical protein TrCOL_g5531 [Triparma columacea]